MSPRPNAGQRARLSGPVGDVFPPTAQGVLEWARTTSPPPDHAAVLAYARGTLPRAEQAKLRRAGYPEL